MQALLIAAQRRNARIHPKGLQNAIAHQHRRGIAPVRTLVDADPIVFRHDDDALPRQLHAAKRARYPQRQRQRRLPRRTAQTGRRQQIGVDRLCAWQHRTRRQQKRAQGGKTGGAVGSAVEQTAGRLLRLQRVNS